MEIVQPGGGSIGTTLTLEMPIGLVDDTNTTFMVVNPPLFINVNGSLYSVGNGLYTSFAGGTIALSSPVGVGGFIESYYNV